MPQPPPAQPHHPAPGDGTSPTTPTTATSLTPATPPLTPEAQADYAALYSSAYAGVVAVLSRSVPSSDAEDLAQSAFLNVYCNWSTIADRSPQAQRAYVLQAARNGLRDAQRRIYAHPGGQPTSLDRLWARHDGADLSALSDHADALHLLLASADPRDDPELHYLLREALGEALGGGVGSSGVPQTLAALEVILLADGCGSAEVVRRLRRAAQLLPQDPDASYFRTITVSALKGRLLRRRAQQRKRQQDRPGQGQDTSALPSTRAARAALRKNHPLIRRTNHPHHTSPAHHEEPPDGSLR